MRRKEDSSKNESTYRNCTGIYLRRLCGVRQEERAKERVCSGGRAAARRFRLRPVLKSAGNDPGMGPLAAQGTLSEQHELPAIAASASGAETHLALGRVQ